VKRNVPDRTIWSTDDDYRDALEGARDAVASSANSIFTAMVNLAFTGPWSEKNKGYAVGDRVRFSPGEFEELNDPVVEKLLAAYRVVDKAADELELLLLAKGGRTIWSTG